MKQSLFFLLGLCLLTFGCAPKTTDNAEAGTVADGATPAPADAAQSAGNPAASAALLGFYVGKFEASKFHKGKNPSHSNLINISIDEMADGKVSGHSVVAGNARPFAGTFTKDGNNFVVEAAEPGDDKYDGKFSFTLNPDTKSISGTWLANDANLAVYERKYELSPRTFKYDATLNLPEDVAWSDLYSKVPDPEWQRAERTTDEAIRLNASNVKLTDDDVANMYKGDLEILRNSIYARHGYSFKTRKMRYVFDNYVNWYIPVSTDVSKELTKLENENIALIKRYEEHAENYYDTFGR